MEFSPWWVEGLTDSDLCPMVYSSSDFWPEQYSGEMGITAGAFLFVHEWTTFFLGVNEYATLKPYQLGLEYSYDGYASATSEVVVKS